MKLYRLFFTIIASITVNHAVCMVSAAREAIDSSRITTVTIKCVAFDESTKHISFGVMDTVSNDTIQIFETLYEQNFPIYTASCFAPREVIGGSFVSMHAYGAAIDINYLMNPYFNVPNFSIIPGRAKDRTEDERSIREDLSSIGISTTESEAIVDIVITRQPEGSDDWFLNRGIIRKGMVTPEVVTIFRQHGFNGWGGMWRQPMDYMHFQTPRPLAEKLANETNPVQREKLWNSHLETCR